MKTDNADNAGSTDTTSTTAPGKNPSESEYLSHQAAEAQEAISRVMDDLKHHLATGADPRLWARHYPWSTLGSAALVGFVAAYGLIPSREQQALKKLREVERALDRDEANGRAGEEADKKNEKRSSPLQGLLKHLMSAAGPAVMSALTAAVSQAMHQAGDQSSDRPCDPEAVDPESAGLDEPAAPPRPPGDPTPRSSGPRPE